MRKKRRPTHPGEVLDELYIKPLKLNLQKLAERLEIPRNTLLKIRAGKVNVTPAIALSLAQSFDTTPQLWLNLQKEYDLWDKYIRKAYREATKDEGQLEAKEWEGTMNDGSEDW